MEKSHKIVEMAVIQMFEKKFSVGLFLNVDKNEFDDFLHHYGSYINTIYFSLPLGRRFHSRSHIAKQFENVKTVELFWDLIKCVVDHKISLEVLFNTCGLSYEDVKGSATLLKEHNIEVNSVALLDQYYEWVNYFFPNKEYVFSYNNFINSFDDIVNIDNKYSKYVIGRQNIRNFDLFDQIKKKLGAKTVLLLNNGCSHFCGWCNDVPHCNRSFTNSLKNYSVEELYAIQSLLPFELHEFFSGNKNIELYKINCRNGSLGYVEKCIKSYILNNAKGCISEKDQNYFLWARLAWFEPYFDRFDYDKIIGIKRNLYSYK